MRQLQTLKSDLSKTRIVETINSDIQEEEISECRWMPIDEYLNAENVSEFNKEIVKYTITSPGLAHAAIDGYADPERYEFFMPSHTEFDNS